eukprot:6892898-Pyramimonas_sp.AAC.1
MKVLDGFRHARAADGREWPAWCYVAAVAPRPPARAQGRSSDFDMSAIDEHVEVTDGYLNNSLDRKRRQHPWFHMFVGTSICCV